MQEGGVAYPFQVSMDHAEVVHIQQSVDYIDQLHKSVRVSPKDK